MACILRNCEVLDLYGRVLGTSLPHTHVVVCLLCLSGLRCLPCYFFFSSRRRHTRSLCDWSSDVCSSDLVMFGLGAVPEIVGAQMGYTMGTAWTGARRRNRPSTSSSKRNSRTAPFSR